MILVQGPWHSVNSDIYHDNPDCQTGSSIDPETLRRGTGGNRLCEECARLKRAAGSVDNLGRGGREDLPRREAARSQTAGEAYEPPAETSRGRRAGEPRVGHLSEDIVRGAARRSEEHTSELQSRPYLVC